MAFPRLLQQTEPLPLDERQIEIDARYARYAERQAAEVSALRRDEAQRLPETLDYGRIEGLSHELRDKLKRARPETLGQASNIDGMTPAALTLLLIHAKRTERLAS